MPLGGKGCAARFTRMAFYRFAHLPHGPLPDMPVLQDVLHVLDHALQLQGRALAFDAQTPLLGDLPEMDSMAVLAVLTGLEDHFGVAFDDADIQGDVFATVGSLCDLVTTTQARAV